MRWSRVCASPLCVLDEPLEPSLLYFVQIDTKDRLLCIYKRYNVQTNS